MVVPAQYENASIFAEGLAAVRQNGKDGYIDVKGNMVIPPRFDAGSIFKEDRAAVKNGNRWSYIDKKGEQVTESRYVFTFAFTEGLSSVVVVEKDGKWLLITKGAPEEIFQRCTRFELEGEVLPMDPVLIQDLRDEYERLSADGFRVLAVAYKDLPQRAAYSKEDETDLILRGYVAFLDPPKGSATLDRDPGV